MLIIPAIDIINGKCVRLTKGKYDSVVIYDDDPVKTALRWVENGAKILHLVDLDGAKNSFSVNTKTIKLIRSIVKVSLQVGGGISSERAADEFISLGVNKIILGTMIFENPLLLKRIIKKYPGQIIVSLDAKNGKLMKKGWQESTGINIIDFAQELEKQGVTEFIFTDVAKDGTLTIPNYKIIKLLKSKVKVTLIAAGGISTIESLNKLKDIGVDGAIIGKALYEGRINLKEALDVG